MYSTVFWPYGEKGLSKGIPIALISNETRGNYAYSLRYYDLRVCGTLDNYMFIKYCPDSRVCHQENAGFFYIRYQFPKHSARHSDLIVLVVVPVVLAFWRCFANMIDLVGILLHTSPRLMVLQPYCIIQSVRYTLFVSLELS